MKKERREEALQIIKQYDPALADAVLYTKGYTDKEIEELYKDYHRTITPYIGLTIPNPYN